MKPHEETWGDDYEVTVVGPRLERHEDIQREVLARAAPEMARAILGDLVEGGPDDAHRHTKQCWANRSTRAGLRLDGPCSPDCARKRTILTKAGVPLP